MLVTAYPVAANHDCWWLTTLARWRRLHAIPRSALDPNDKDAFEELCTAPGLVLRALCGCEGLMAFPGPFSRLGMKRCQNCCRKLGISAGKGTPANNKEIEYSKQPGGVVSTAGPVPDTDYRNPVQDA